MWTEQTHQLEWQFWFLGIWRHPRHPRKFYHQYLSPEQSVMIFPRELQLRDNFSYISKIHMLFLCRPAHIWWDKLPWKIELNKAEFSWISLADCPFQVLNVLKMDGLTYSPAAYTLTPIIAKTFSLYPEFNEEHSYSIRMTTLDNKSHNET